MSTADPTHSQDGWRQLAVVYDRFEEAWSTCGEPVIEDFLPPVGNPDRLVVLNELVRIDMERRWARGNPAHVEEYLRRFPELASDDSSLSLLKHEIQIRNLYGQTPENAELRSRFPELADELPPDLTTLQPRPISQAPVIGNRLGRYTIRGELGRGGFSTVYRAWDDELCRDVAIKVPRRDLLIDDQLRERQLREARSAARLRHPAIVPLHEVGQDGRSAFLVYEFVSGPTLAELQRKTRPAPQQAARWVAALAEALDYAHSCGIVHRDVKPANVLMRGGTEPLLTDFGLALQADAAATITQQGDILGTPAYMSPEQARGGGHLVDGRCDVYSLGVVLYELLTGRVPFQSRGGAVLHQILNEEPTPPRMLAPIVPLDLETICLKAMTKEPGQRYATAGALAEDLRRFLDHRPIRARRIGPMGRIRRWCRRNPQLALTLTAAAASVMLVAGFAYRGVLLERDRYRVERDRANANLYQALLSDGRAQTIARETGWWWKTLSNVQAAAQLEVPNRNPRELRELAIEAIGTNYHAMREHRGWAGHQGTVTAIAVDPKGEWVASAGIDGSVSLWAVPEGTKRGTLTGHERPALGLAVSPSGQFIVSAGVDGVVRVFLRPEVPETGIVEIAPQREIRLSRQALTFLTFSSDGGTVAVADRAGQIFLIAATPEGLEQSPAKSAAFRTGQAVSCLLFTPDNQQLVSSDLGQVIRYWDLQSRQSIRTVATWKTPSYMALAPGGILGWSDIEAFGFATRNYFTGVSTPFPRVHASGVHQIEWDAFGWLTASSDGSILCTSQSGGDRRTTVAVARVTGAGVTRFARFPDNRWLIAGYQDGRLRIWERLQATHCRLVNTRSPRMAFLPNSRRFIDDTSVFEDPIADPATSTRFQMTTAPIAMHPNGERLAWCSSPGGIAIQRLDDNSARQVATDKIVALESDHRGAFLAGATSQGTIHIWDWESHRLVRTLNPDIGTIGSLSWSADDQTLAAAGSRGVRAWDRAGDGPMRTLAEHGTGTVALSKDTAAIANSIDEIEIRTLADGKLLRRLTGHRALVIGLRFFADGKRLASHGQGESIRLWDTSTGESLGELEAQQRPLGRSLAIDPKERYLLACGHLLWDLRSRRLVGATTRGWADSHGQFLKDGSAVIYCGIDGALRRCNLASVEKALAKLGGPGGERTLTNLIALSIDAVLTPGGNTDKVWGIAASPDGRWFACGCHDGTVHLWDAATRKKVRTFRGQPGIVWTVAFSPDSRRLATGPGDIHIWDIATGRLEASIAGHTRLIRGLAYHPTLPYLASVASDGSVRLWNTSTNEAVGVVHQFECDLFGVAFHPTGRHLIVSGDDGTVSVWDFAAEPQINRLPDRTLRQHTDPVWDVAFHPAGTYLASCSNPGTIILWDGATFEPIVTLRAGTGEIRGLSFSADGELLGGAAYENLGVVWDLPGLKRQLAELGIDW